jgi:hypothetical protein
MPTLKTLAPFCGLPIAVIVLTGCASSFANPFNAANLPGFVPGLPKGYQCPLVPNGFDPAGSIYRIDQADTYYRVKDFSNDPAVTATGGYRKNVPISNYVLSDKQTSTAGLSLAVLKTALPGLTASANADLNKQISVDITVEDMVGEVIDDTVADYIGNWFMANIEPKPGNKYFLVRETVRAGSISVRLHQEDLAKLGGKAQLEKLAEGSANVTIDDSNGTLEIKQKFAERMPVCIKSAEIILDGQKPTHPLATSVALKSADDTSMPMIKAVGAEWVTSTSR